MNDLEYWNYVIDATFNYFAEKIPDFLNTDFNLWHDNDIQDIKCSIFTQCIEHFLFII